MVKEVWKTNSIEISDEVRHNESHASYNVQKKKPYGAGNQESNRLAWQSSGAFPFALRKCAEKALSVCKIWESVYPWEFHELISELVSQGPKHFLASRENLCVIYKGGGLNMWIPKALKEFVTVKFQQSKQNNGITEDKMQKQGLLCWNLPERKNCQELTCRGNILCG